MTPRPARRTLPTLALLGAALLTACGSNSSTGTTTSKDALRFSTSNLPVGYVNEPYSADLQVAGGQNPYLVRLTDGALPDGVQLTGTGLSGTPTKAGVYAFSLEASVASLSTRVQKYTVNVSAQVAFELRPALPNGPVGESRIPLVVNHPKGATAARFQWQLPAGARVASVTAGDGQPVMFWKQNSAGLLTLDLGFRKVPANGARVAMINLKPAQPVLLANAPVAFQGRDATGKSVGSQDFPPPNTPTAGTSGTSTGADSTSGTSTDATSTDATSTDATSAAPADATSAQGTSTDATSADGTSTDAAPGVSAPVAPTETPPDDAAPVPGTSTNGGSQ